LALAAEPRLSGLACQGAKSVTIRNALDHGNAIHNPQTRVAEFVDGKRSDILADAEVRIQAIDMALSNWTMLMTMLLVVDIRYDEIRAWRQVAALQ
jgi:hypothetical protein